MAVTAQSTGDKYTIGAALQRMQYLHHLHPSGAGHHQHSHVGRILQPQGAGQVRGGICTVLAAESQDVRLKAVGCHRSLHRHGHAESYGISGQFGVIK
jgi:hypothetical protein